MGDMKNSHKDNTIEVDDNFHRAYSILPVHIP